jgi:hypothetical protein
MIDVFDVGTCSAKSNKERGSRSKDAYNRTIATREIATLRKYVETRKALRKRKRGSHLSLEIHFGIPAAV